MVRYKLYSKQKVPFFVSNLWLPVIFSRDLWINFEPERSPGCYVYQLQDEHHIRVLHQDWMCGMIYVRIVCKHDLALHMLHTSYKTYEFFGMCISTLLSIYTSISTSAEGHSCDPKSSIELRFCSCFLLNNSGCLLMKTRQWHLQRSIG